MITLRIAQENDAESIALHNQAMALETENKTLDWEIVFTGVESVLADPAKGFYLVAVSEGEVLGNLMITYEWSDWRNCNLWWFQSVYLRPEIRKQKVFSQMFSWIKEKAKADGVKELRLYVEKENVNAQLVYKAMGMGESHYLMFDMVVG